MSFMMTNFWPSASALKPQKKNLQRTYRRTATSAPHFSSMTYFEKKDIYLNDRTVHMI